MKANIGNEWKNICSSAGVMAREIFRRLGIVFSHFFKAGLWLSIFVAVGYTFFSHTLPLVTSYVEHFLQTPCLNCITSAVAGISEASGLTWSSAKSGHRFYKTALIFWAVLKGWSRL